MGCGASSAKVAVEPVQTGLQSQGHQDQVDKSKTKDMRTSSGKSRDSGFFADNHTDTPQPKSVGFKAAPPLTGKVQADEDEKEVLQKLRNEGLIQRSMTKTNFGVSFEVVEDNRTVRSRPPPRLARLERDSVLRKSVTDEEIKAKLEKAKRRKRAQEAKRLSRIQSLTRQGTNVNPESLHTTDSYPHTETRSDALYKDVSRAKSGESNQNNLFNVQSNHSADPVPSESRRGVYWGSAREFTPPNSSRRSPSLVLQQQTGADQPSLYGKKNSTGSNFNRDNERVDRNTTSSYVGHYVDDLLSRDSNLDMYTHEAARGVTAMLEAAQDKVEKYNRNEMQDRDSLRGSLGTSKSKDQTRNSPGVNSLMSESPSNYTSTYPAGTGSKWLKSYTRNKQDKPDDVIRKHDDVYDSDNERIRDRTLSRLSVPSVGSSDSVDFWNE